MWSGHYTKMTLGITSRNAMLSAKLLRTCCRRDPKLFCVQHQNVRYIVTKAQDLKKEFSRGRKIGAGGFFLLIIPVASFCLGVWQVHRRQWKLGLIAELKSLTHSEPIPLPESIEELENLEYRPVKVRGEFDHTHELYMTPRSLIKGQDYGLGLVSMGGQNTGSWVITPFTIADTKRRILINRGWVPREKQNPEKRKGGQISGEIELVGLVRKTEKRQQFRPKNDIEANRWSFRDIDAMAYRLGTEPVYLDATAGSTVKGGPIGGQTKVTLRNEHFSYIVTWFSLSAITSYLWYARFWYKPVPK